MPYSTGCKTPLSNFEAGLNYKDVSDPAVMVSFPLLDDPDGASLVAWTTTPWTLPSNLALCVNPAFTYCKVPRNPRRPSNPRFYAPLPPTLLGAKYCLDAHLLSGCTKPRSSVQPLCRHSCPSAWLQVRNRETGAVLVVAECRVGVLPSLPKASGKAKQQQVACVAEPGPGSEGPHGGSAADVQTPSNPKAPAPGPGTAPPKKGKKGGEKKEKADSGSGPSPGPQLDPAAYELLGTVSGQELAGKRWADLASSLPPFSFGAPARTPAGWLSLDWARLAKGGTLGECLAHPTLPAS